MTFWLHNKYDMRRFKTDFFTLIFWSRISLLLLMVHIWSFTGIFRTFIWREPCLRILIKVLVLILCQNTGRFLYFFQDYFSRFHKMKTRAYIRNMRHRSLHTNVFYNCVKFYVWEMNINGDILVQKIKVKKYIFKFLAPSFCYLFSNLHVTYKFRYLFLLVIYW